MEIEATLIICSKNSKEIMRNIASLASLVDYRLLPKDSKTIHDVYFDTCDRTLESQKLALRIREISQIYWLTLKDPSRMTNWGAVERLEIEVPWSGDNLNCIIKELMHRGIKTPQQHPHFDVPRPLDVMTSLGLEVIQDRETHRITRNIVLGSEESGSVLAELAIDSVVYRISGREVCHHEVEIEAKEDNIFSLLKTVTNTLIDLYRPALRRWNHSKLATGKALEKLLVEGALRGMIDANNNLNPIAYDRIDDHIEHGGI